MEQAMTFYKSQLEKIKFFITTQDIKVESTHINHKRIDNEVRIQVTAKGNENNVTLFFRDLTAFLS